MIGATIAETLDKKVEKALAILFAKCARKKKNVWISIVEKNDHRIKKLFCKQFTLIFAFSRYVLLPNYFFSLHAALVICGLFICNFTYMRLKNGLFSGTYPLIYCNPRSFYMRIHYMRAYFWSPYLSHITRSTSTIYSIFREPSKELAEPLGSAEPRLKNTGLKGQIYKKGFNLSQD